MCVVPGDWLAVLSCGILCASRKVRGVKKLVFSSAGSENEVKMERVSISYNECDLRSETKAV